MGPLACVLLDVEGTTTALSFVRDVLFPYSDRHLGPWLAEHAGEPAVAECLDQVRLAETGPVVEVLRRWIAEDRKHPALKQLQGLIWRAGYQDGALRGHVFDDVPGCLRRWRQAGMVLAIYSSGSVEAQQLLFRHSTAGDLSPLFQAHFDTRVGGKREPRSYGQIAAALTLPPAAILFLSDVAEELDAARAAGLATLQIVRPGTTPGADHPWAADLLELDRLIAPSS
jgi:enolase-phosphatase E1